MPPTATVTNLPPSSPPTPPRYFGNVCELDIIFNFHRAYHILDELMIGGYIQDTSKKEVLKVRRRRASGGWREETASDAVDALYSLHDRTSLTTFHSSLILTLLLIVSLRSSLRSLQSCSTMDDMMDDEKESGTGGNRRNSSKK